MNLAILVDDVARQSRSQRWTALLEQARDGDEQAFATLLAEAEEHLCRRAYEIVGDAGLAEDVVSLTFVRLRRYLSRFDASRSNARTWMYRMVRQVAQDQYEKRARLRRVEVTGYEVLFGRPAEEGEGNGGMEPEDPQALDPAREADRPFQRGLVQEALARLSLDDRRLLEWFHIEQVSYEEIARRLGCSRKAVGPRLTRSRQRLRELLPPDVQP